MEDRSQEQRKHIFAINGSPDFLNVIRDRFQDEGYNVTTTNFVPNSFEQIAALDPDSVNRSGGALGEGHLHEATGLARALACVERLRAGDARVAVAQSWRGVPSTTSAVAVLMAGG